jgi:ribosomal protein uS17
MGCSQRVGQGRNFAIRQYEWKKRQPTTSYWETTPLFPGVLTFLFANLEKRPDTSKISGRRHNLAQVANTPTDKKCPFVGLVSIRGRILTGRVVSTKMHRTLVIRREYLHYVPKYNRYEKRHKNLAAHVSPAFRVQEGDWVTVGQCRPLSKTVRSILTLRAVWRIRVVPICVS